MQVNDDALRDVLTSGRKSETCEWR